MTVFARYRTDDLRRAYMPGVKRIGRVNVAAYGLRYTGKLVGVLEFARHGEVRYYLDENASFCFAAFNKDGASLDD